MSNVTIEYTDAVSDSEIALNEIAAGQYFRGRGRSDDSTNLFLKLTNGTVTFLDRPGTVEAPRFVFVEYEPIAKLKIIATPGPRPR